MNRELLTKYASREAIAFMKRCAEEGKATDITITSRGNGYYRWTERKKGSNPRFSPERDWDDMAAREIVNELEACVGDHDRQYLGYENERYVFAPFGFDEDGKPFKSEAERELAQLDAGELDAPEIHACAICGKTKGNGMTIFKAANGKKWYCYEHSYRRRLAINVKSVAQRGDESVSYPDNIADAPEVK
jgi:hypothetical protein